MKKILIIGMGASGKALYRYLERKNVDISVYDQKLPNGHSYKVYDPNDHFDLALLSPGIPLTHEVVLWCKEKGVEVQGEIQFAASHIKGTLLGITGTNGKSTSVSLLYEVLKTERDRVFLAGNIGTPLIDFVEDSREGDIYVVELSSFQLETTEKLTFFAGAILNLTPDHILWHGSFENYREAKGKLLDQSKYVILNADDPALEPYEKGHNNILFFSKEPMDKKGSFVRENIIYYRDDQHEEAVMHRQDLFLEGDFNLENALAVIIFSKLMKVSNETITKVLSTFKGIPHRYETLGEYQGVLVINDSKATNPESTIPKLKSLTRPTILIAGGMHKGSDFSELASLIKEHIKWVYLFGENKESFLKALEAEDFKNVTLVKDLPEAFAASLSQAQAGDQILLSPASASWDMYESYEKRGDHLRTLFGELQ